MLRPFFMPMASRAPLFRIAFPTLVAVGGSVATWILFFGDLRFFLEPREPRDLGDATRLSDDLASHSFVRLRGLADLASSVRVGRSDRGDQRVARLLGGSSLVVVPASGATGTPPDGSHGLDASGFFDGSGRFWRAEDLPAAWRPVVRRFEPRGAVRYVLHAGERPSDAWLAPVACGAVGVFGGLALWLGARALRRVRRAIDSEKG
jgi:hypothetical protein